MKSTAFHIRGQDGQKLVGGTSHCGGTMDEASENLVRHLEIGVTPSGRVTFMRKLDPVFVYLAVDPAESETGKAILARHRAAMAQIEAVKERERKLRDEALDNRVQVVLDHIGYDELMFRLADIRDGKS